MRRRRKTKILATLGPASSTPESIRALFEAGADAFRINMSHTSHAGLAELHRHVRAVEEAVGRPIGILADLQGPKIRLGTLPGGMRAVHTGDKLHLVRKVMADNAADIPIPHAEVFAALRPGETILIDDGKVRLRIEAADKEWADAVVEAGGMLKDKKGVNLPDTVLPIPAMTPKDRSDLDAALHLGVDWIALSFVQRADDVAEMKKIVGGRAGRAIPQREERVARVEPDERTRDRVDVLARLLALRLGPHAVHARSRLRHGRPPHVL